MPSLVFQFLPARTYRDELLALIPTAQRRIVIHAMDLLWEPLTEPLIPLLLAAATRGVEVRLVGDVFSQTHARSRRTAEEMPPWSHTVEQNAQLKRGGVHVTYIGRLGANPYRGRCHSKVTLIDDHAFTFGGVNFTHNSFTHRDYMLHAENAALADKLYRLVRQIEQNNPTPLPDIKEQLSPATTLLFDGGTPRVSPIYETACDAVRQAKKVYYVSQMCPSGQLAQLINTTDNECYFIHPSQTELLPALALAFDQQRYRIRNRYRRDAYIHAKFILTEGHDGSRHIVSGSNNFSWRGVAYGTKEIAMHATDPALWQQFYDFLRAEIA